jgi:predicted P-loop ATPase
VLRFNEFSQACEVWPPFPPQGDLTGTPRSLQDPYDTLLATIHFQANGFDEVNKNLVWDALITVARDNSYHPVRDYLSGLRWDGVARVGSLFQRYFNAELPKESEPRERDRHGCYLENVSTSFMVGAGARIMQPGCKHDHVPIVIGRYQGTQKSRAIQALCPDPAWFTDDISPDLANRDTKEGLRGKWLVELSEIPHVSGGVERVKAFLSRQVDRYRVAYGRATQDYPRQCAFIGTSNDIEFSDVTGNRRLWPVVSVGKIDVEAIERDRDQLWAEAVQLYRDGVPWWLAPGVEQIAAERQEAFVETDVWDGLIEIWIAGHPAPFKMEDLFAANTGIVPYRELAATQKADEVRAGRCLKRLGFYRSRCTLNGKRAYWWLPRPKPFADPPPGGESPIDASPTAVRTQDSAGNANASSDDIEVL